jgi:nicotinamidase-related amidase
LRRARASSGAPSSGSLIDELAPQQGDLIVAKRTYSAFTQTDLDATCRVHHVARLVVTGQHTDGCCRHTSYDAFTRGIKVVAVADATAVYLWGSETSHRLLTCGFACGIGRAAGNIAGLRPYGCCT